jgi:hypothetical protein
MIIDFILMIVDGQDQTLHLIKQLNLVSDMNNYLVSNMYY